MGSKQRETWIDDPMAMAMDRSSLSLTETVTTAGECQHALQSRTKNCRLTSRHMLDRVADQGQQNEPDKLLGHAALLGQPADRVEQDLGRVPREPCRDQEQSNAGKRLKLRGMPRVVVVAVKRVLGRGRDDGRDSRAVLGGACAPEHARHRREAARRGRTAARRERRQPVGAREDLGVVRVRLARLVMRTAGARELEQAAGEGRASAQRCPAGSQRFSSTH